MMKQLNGRYVTDSGEVVMTEDGLERLIKENRLESGLLIERTYETELLQQHLKKSTSMILNFCDDERPELTYEWNTPEPFKNMDVEEYIFSLSKSKEEDERIALELSMFNERNLYPLLRHIIFLVDHFRKNNILWGVGRGSSVNSYVLFLIGIHKINSIKYGLSIEEFLK